MKLICIFIILYIIGYLSNYISPYYIQSSAILADSFQTFKPFLFFIFVYSFSKQDTLTYLSKKLSPVLKFIVLISFILSIISQFIDINMTSGIRYGIQAFKFTFEFPGEFGFFIIFCFMLFLTIESEKNLKWLILCVFLIVFTTKLQSIIFLFFLSVFFYLINRPKRWRVFLPFEFILGCIFLWKLSYNQLYEYFLDLNHYSPRRIFLSTAFEIAKTSFPLGTGFGSFGSDAAAKYYSNVYIYYGFNNLYAMDIFGGALNDNYIASIIGQFGYVGLLFFILLLVIILRKIKFFWNNKYKNLAYSIIFMTIFASMGSGTIRSSTGMLLYGGLALIFSNQLKKETL